VFTVVDAAEATAARESLGVGAGDEQSERLSPDECGQDELLGRSDPLPGDPIGQTENTWGEPVGGFPKKGDPCGSPTTGTPLGCGLRRPSRSCIPQYARPGAGTNISAAIPDAARAGLARCDLCHTAYL